MKIGIITCMWRRPKIFDIFATGINRLRNSYDIVPLAVGSEGSQSMNLCRKHEFMYLERPNKPLGRKFNDGIRCFRNTDVDYVMVMGSDDLISNSLIDAYMPHMLKGEPLIGILDIYFYDMFDKSLHYWPGYGFKKADMGRKGEPLGMARCLSRDLLNRMKWNVWTDNINKGLDWSMWHKLKAHKIKPVTMKLKDTGTFGVDLKSELNICSQILYTCAREDDSIMSTLSETERQLIKEYGAKK
ncbi:MAG: hypothetical protein E4H16_02375 [Candidatus Atribacteria bacterium]|nr:MAG: hypothetical protein E4H16_02375 [Candidatus Atribacteria bacterium]